MTPDIQIPQLPDSLDPQLRDFLNAIQKILSQKQTDDYSANQELLDSRFPVGTYYAQFPAAASNTDSVAFPTEESPAALYGGTWEEQWTGEGIVFQTAETTDHYTRTSGLMEDHSHGHIHTGPGGYMFLYVRGSGGIYAIASGTSIDRTTVPAADMGDNGTDGDPRHGSRTSHRNRNFKVWKRIS